MLRQDLTDLTRHTEMLSSPLNFAIALCRSRSVWLPSIRVISSPNPPTALGLPMHLSRMSSMRTERLKMSTLLVSTKVQDKEENPPPRSKERTVLHRMTRERREAGDKGMAWETPAAITSVRPYTTQTVLIRLFLQDVHNLKRITAKVLQSILSTV